MIQHRRRNSEERSRISIVLVAAIALATPALGMTACTLGSDSAGPPNDHFGDELACCSERPAYFRDRFLSCFRDKGFCDRPYASCEEFCSGWMGCEGEVAIDSDGIGTVSGGRSLGSSGQCEDHRMTLAAEMDAALERITPEDIQTILEFHELSLTPQELADLDQALADISVGALLQLTDPTQNKRSQFARISWGRVAVGAFVGALVVGAAAVSAVALLPAATVYGFSVAVGVSLPTLVTGAAVAGATAGGAIGAITSETTEPPFEATWATIGNLTPAGGPYPNNNQYQDFFKFNKNFGSPNLPFAGVLLPPASNGAVYVYYPNDEAFVTPMRLDPLMRPAVLDSDGVTPVFRTAAFVIVKTTSGRYQMRVVPSSPLLPDDRPVHSQLTNNSVLYTLFAQLIGSNESQDVWAAGELYLRPNGEIFGVTSRTGHYYTRSDSATFDREVLSTTKMMLDALGYNTNAITFARADDASFEQMLDELRLGI